MKKALVIFGILLLTGLGCNGGQANGPWRLSFNLPEGWVIYDEGDGGYLGIPSENITPELSSIVLQNKLEVTYTRSLDDLENNTYDGLPVINEGFSAIKVQVLDSRRIIPRNAETVSKFIVRDRVCGGDMSPCEEGEFPFKYYFADGDTKYSFEIFGDQAELNDIESIITSARRTRIR